MSATNPMPRRRADAEGPPEKLVSISIRFPASLRQRALVIAESEYRTFASLVLAALDRYVTEKEQAQAQENGK